MVICHENDNSNVERNYRYRLRESQFIENNTLSLESIGSRMMIVEDEKDVDDEKGNDDYDEIQVLARVNHCKTHVLNFLKNSSTATNRNSCSSSSSSSSVVVLSRTPTLEDIRRVLCRVLGLTYDLNECENNSSCCNHTALHFLSTQRSSNGSAVLRKEEKVWWLSCVTRVPAVGGKGGFGTLLKGQSKQAGARRTIDFGACRDLNGRRLRHVNDEIKLQKWRQQQQQQNDKNNNSSTMTQSGIENWHLAIPHWSDQHSLSNKAKRRIDLKQQRQIQQKQLKEQQKQQAKLQQQQQYKNAIQQYVNHTTTTTMSMKDSVQKGILASLQNNKSNIHGKRKRPPTNIHSNATPNDTNIYDPLEAQQQLSWCTLSGDVLIHEFINDVGTVRFHNSMSEFATVALPSVATQLSPKNINNLYYEVTIQTAGLAQIGWASSLTHFVPYDVDGVGDDDFSFGYDGYRCAKFHSTTTPTTPITPTASKDDMNSINPSYGKQWQTNDVISCYIYTKINNETTNIVVEYFHNGKSLGKAFTIPSTTKLETDEKNNENTIHNLNCHSTCQDDNFYYPALSLNEGEIIDVNVGPNFKYKDCIAKHGIFTSLSTLYHLNNKNSAATTVSEHEEEDFDEEEKKTHKRLKDNSHSNNFSESNIEEDKDKELVDEKKPPAKNRHDDRNSKYGDFPSNISSTTSNYTALIEKEPKRKEELIKILTMDDLNKYSSIQELEELGLDNLKKTLIAMGLKCGGTLHDRAVRLFSVKGMNDRGMIPKKLRGKNFSLIKP